MEHQVVILEDFAIPEPALATSTVAAVSREGRAWSCFQLSVATLVGAILLMVICYRYVDVPVAQAARGIHSTPFYFLLKFVQRLGEAHYPLAASGLAYFYYRKRKPEVARAALFVFLSVVVTGLACDAIKPLAARYRPTMLFQENNYGFHFLRMDARYNSFPSGHATTAFACATAILLIAPRWAAAAFVLAAMVAAGRIVTGAHYPSDIVMGVWLGMVGTCILAQVFPARKRSAT